LTWLDPRIHLLRKKIFTKMDGLPGQGPAMTLGARARFIDELQHASIDSAHIPLLE
jgi:hypothetical protein